MGEEGNTIHTPHFDLDLCHIRKVLLVPYIHTELAREIWKKPPNQRKVPFVLRMPACIFTAVSCSQSPHSANLRAGIRRAGKVLYKKESVARTRDRKGDAV